MTHYEVDYKLYRNNQLGALTTVTGKNCFIQLSTRMAGWLFITFSICDCNWTRTQNHLVLKRTLNHLAKLSKEFLDIQATVECGFTLKRVRDMTRTYSLFDMFTQSIKFYYTLYYHELRKEMFEKCDSSNKH